MSFPLHENCPLFELQFAARVTAMSVTNNNQTFSFNLVVSQAFLIEPL